MSATDASPSPRHGFRFLTLSLACSPALPILPYEAAEGGWRLLNLMQAVALHFRSDPLAHLGGLLLLGPALLAAISLGLSSRHASIRRSLALVALGLSALGPLAAHLAPPSIAAWFAMSAMLPASQYVRAVWMTALLSALWVYMEAREVMEPR